MKIAFVIFDRLTALDLIGVYDPLTRLRSMGFMADLEWQLCAYTESVTDDRGLRLSPDRVQEPLDSYDLVSVPGGIGTRELMNNAQFIGWLRSAQPASLKASVCTGALLLGAAGFLKGKRATTHPKAINELAPFCAEVVNDRVVDAGQVVTAGGVTAAIDLGLYLVERLAGRETRAQVARQMDYPY